MHSSKILLLVAIGLLCINARVLKKKIRQRIASPSCTCPLSIQEPTYGCYGVCSCQNVFLDELTCGCQYVDTYGVLSPELPNYGRLPAIRLPKLPVMPIASCDPGMPVGCYDVLPVSSYEVLPAINLPGLCDVLPQAMPCVTECSCQMPMACQYLDTCGCRMLNPMIIPTESCIQAPKCQPQVIQSQSCACGCQTMPCSCQNLPCGCQYMPCGCQNMPCGCQNVPCGCQNMPCGCQNMPCGCQNVACGCQTVPCGCQSMSCGCENMPCSCQNYNCQFQSVYAPPMPVLELPCACQACQLSPVELPAYSYSCQSLPPPVIGCGGKYLRQVTIQPPFL